MAWKNNKQGNIERLNNYCLDIYNTAEEIAAAMKISISKLEFLAFNNKILTVSHYIHFKTAKKNVGNRIISSPLPDLKRAQHWILKNILQKIEIHDAAHGFCCDRSIVTNTNLHVGAEVIINFYY